MDFRRREGKWYPQQGTVMRISERQRETRSEGWRRVDMGRHKDHQGIESGRKGKEEVVRGKSANCATSRLGTSFHSREFMILWCSPILRPDTDLLRRIWRASMQCFWITSWYSWGCRGNFPASNSAVRTNLRSLNLPKERGICPGLRRQLKMNSVG